MEDPDIFEPFDRLIDIKVCGRISVVPENNSILRCLQYLDMESVSHADLCWNGECLNCQVWIMQDGKEKAVIACRTKVAEQMEIVRISDAIKPGSGEDDPADAD